VVGAVIALASALAYLVVIPNRPIRSAELAGGRVFAASNRENSLSFARVAATVEIVTDSTLICRMNAQVPK
jgi:hypothetical protein